ncbi:MAG: DUF5667 domain-containing protein [Candidatus Hadarchaeales archaeon]
MLGEHGFAAVAVVIVLVSVGAGMATPVIVDSIDVNPDSPLYGLERIGERIRESFAGGQQMDISLAKERTAELELMVRRQKAERYAWLADEIAERLEKATERTAENVGLVRAMEAVQTHTRRLETLLENENLPEKARLAVSFALCRSSAVMGVLSEVQARVEARERIRERIREMREEFADLKKEAEENLRMNLPIEPALHRVHMMVATRLMARIENIIVVKPENAENLAELIQRRLEEALANCTDNQLIEEVLEKLAEYREKLENIRENMPEILPWIPPICNRIVIVIVVVENKVVNIPQVPPIEMRENIKETLRQIREEIREIRQEFKQIREEIRERLRQGENIQEIIDNLDLSTVEVLIKNLQMQVENLRSMRSLDMASEHVYRIVKRLNKPEQLERVRNLLEHKILPLKENVPAGAPVENLIEWTENCLQSINQIQQGVEAGEIPPQQIQSTIVDMIKPPHWRR